MTSVRAQAPLFLALLLGLGAPEALAGDKPVATAAAVAGVPASPAALLPAYDTVRVALVADRLPEAAAAARTLAEQARPSDPALADLAAAVAAAPELPAMRLAYGEFSRTLIQRLGTTGAPKGVFVYRCPMVTTYAFWLQTTSGLANPYMGTAMPTCGEGVSFKAALAAATK